VKRDYYEILGVAPDADGNAIRRAFHALARQWHPDVAESSEAEDRFREITEACSVLSKPEARLLYDRYRSRGRGNQGFDEALRKASPPIPRSENVRIQIKLRAFETKQGTRQVVEYQAEACCLTCMGHGMTGLPDTDLEDSGAAERRQLSDINLAHLFQIEPLPARVGGPCSRCGEKGTVSIGRRLCLLVPEGLDDGAQLRVRGAGNYGGIGLLSSDLLVDVQVLPAPKDPTFIRYTALTLALVSIATLVLYVQH